MTGMYHNTEDGHSKCWQLTKVKDGYAAMYGKIDGTLQGPKVYTEAEAIKVVAAKIKKGYVKI